jgi:hypothetical protein
MSRTLLWATGAVALLAGHACAADPPAPDEVRKKLDGVFRRPEFRPQDPDSWLRDLFRAIGRFLQWLGGLREAAPLLFWLLLSICVGLLVFLAVVVVRKTVTMFYNPGSAAQWAAARQRALRSAEFAAEADRRAAAGDYTEAIRCLFLSLVYRYDESGRVNFREAFTNHEYLGLFDGRPAVQNDLRLFVDALDEHWYGQRPASAAEYQRCRAAYEGLGA